MITLICLSKAMNFEHRILQQHMFGRKALDLLLNYQCDTGRLLVTSLVVELWPFSPRKPEKKNLART